MSTKDNFNIGDLVVYPQQGVGFVKSIRERKKDNAIIKYYEIYLKSSDMVFLIPLDKANDVGLRKVSSTEDVKKAINNISKKPARVSNDWKLRYQMNQELLKRGTIEAIAKIVQTLYHRSKVKELPIQERRLYDTALQILIFESSYALQKDSEEIEALIISKLGN